MRLIKSVGKNSSFCNLLFWGYICAVKSTALKTKIISIFLLLCLVMPIATLYVWLQHRKTIAKQEAKERIIAGIDKKELVLLKFTQQESQTCLHWEHAQEFEYKQQMYDVVETAVRGDTTYYWCWLDSPETRLNTQLYALASQLWEKDTQNQETSKNVLKFYTELFCLQRPVFHFFLYEEAISLCFFYACACLCHAVLPPLPPPETA